MLKGIGTSGGIGIGHVLLIEDFNAEVIDRQPETPDIERKRFLEAKDTFVNSTKEIAANLKEKLGAGDKTALVLQNQIYLINDQELESGITEGINNGLSAENAVDATCRMYADIFRSMDSEVMNQRVADIEDLRNRIVNILGGGQCTDLSSLPPDTIIVASELHPSITATMDTEHVAGIIAEKGGETSHAAILARALEIPAVLSLKGICSRVKDNDPIIIDGEYGEVFLNPSEKTLKIYEKKRRIYAERNEELKRYIDKATLTGDGSKVCLAANIGGDKDCSKAMSLGVDGVGLFRTEFFFLEGVSMPTEEQQFEVYKKAAVLSKDKFITIRTLDIGGDKDIPYMGLVKENNPFLGYRAIRYCLGRVDVFITQLRAILRASAYGKIRIMLPLITTVEEVQTARKIISDICKDLDRKEIPYDKNIQVGVMVETPSASLIADLLAKRADFFSIGTNDLTQYTLAVDRGNENVSYLYSVYNPSVLRSIRNIIACGKEAGIEVGMCGEAAASPGMIPLLLSFGLDEFSVSPSKILETRKNIASWTKEEADKVTGTVMAMESEKEVSGYLSDYIAAREELRRKKEGKADG